MKNIIMTIILILVLPLSVVAQESYTLLLVDKSGSMEAKNAKQDRHIYEVIKQACKAKRATVEVKFVNEATNSLMNKKIFFFEQPVFDAGLYSDDEADVQRQLFGNKIKKAKKNFAKKVIAFINNYDTSAKMTELLSGIVSIARLNAKNTSVYFYTDAVESSRFRDMTRNSFSSEKQAVLAAQSDITKLGKKFQLPKTLSGIKQIRFVVPINMEANNSLLQFLEVYWKEVYRYGFGFENVIFETL